MFKKGKGGKGTQQAQQQDNQHKILENQYLEGNNNKQNNQQNINRATAKQHIIIYKLL